MKTLSIQQPWAWAILHAGKTVENRTWATTYRGPLLIHAGKKIDREGRDWIEGQFRLMIPDGLPVGGIVGMCILDEIIHETHWPNDDDPWFFGPYGWVIVDAEPLPFRPCRGQLGLFEAAYP